MTYDPFTHLFLHMKLIMVAGMVVVLHPLVVAPLPHLVPLLGLVR